MNEIDLSNQRDTEEKASKIHFESIVVDTHNDTMMKVVDSKTFLPIIDIGKKTNFQIDIPKAQSGRLNVAYFAAFVDYEGSDDLAAARTNNRTLSLLNALHWTAKNNLDTLSIATSVKEIKEAILHGKIAAVSTIEGAYALEETNAIELLNQYYDLGVRVIGYVWNPANALGTGTTGPIDMGLTELGAKLQRK